MGCVIAGASDLMVEQYVYFLTGTDRGGSKGGLGGSSPPNGSISRLITVAKA
jgi:hypothetical protein